MFKQKLRCDDFENDFEASKLFVSSTKSLLITTGEKFSKIYLKKKFDIFLVKYLLKYKTGFILN